MISSRHFKRLVKKEKENILERIEKQSQENVGSISVISETQEIDQIPNDEEEIEKESLSSKLAKWYTNSNISREHFDSLLEILRSEGLNVPTSSKTILKNSEICTIRTVTPGTYLHIGLENQLKKVANLLLELIIDVGIDGLPLYKSSENSLWPIMGKLANIKNVKVFLIGVYLGKKKPNNADHFLHDFVEELKYLNNNKFFVSNKGVSIKIRAFVCDAPARAFICGTVSHSSFYACSKCTQVGAKINNVVCYSKISGTLRSDNDFNERKDKFHHKSYYFDKQHLLETIGIGMVTKFPLDPMHLIDLGVTKKIILCILNGKVVNQKLTKLQKETLSKQLLTLTPFIPKEFARKPRSLDEISRWKSIEFRQFILYTGILVLKDILNENCYFHFCLLHCAYRLLSHRKSYLSNLETANSMLKLFVEQFDMIYNEGNLTYNVHSLLHIVDCVKQVGFINDFAAYPFENFMGKLKKKVKKPTEILQQINNKIYTEILTLKQRNYGLKRNAIGIIISFSTSDMLLSVHSPNNYCCICSCTGVKIMEFMENEEGVFIKGKKLKNCRNFFDIPVHSMADLGIFLADKLTEEEDGLFSINKIAFKLVALPYKDDYLFIPIIHSNT